MIEIELRHNPFLDKSEVLINGLRPAASTLCKHLNKPFSEWVDKIFDSCSLEACDEYSFVYVGLPFYAHMLKHYADKNDDCVSFKQKPPPLNDSCTCRLNELSLLYHSGLQIKRFDENITVYSNLGKADIENLFYSSLKLPFHKINLNISSVAHLKSDENFSSPCFILTEDELNIVGNTKFEIFYIRISDSNTFLGYRNGVFYEEATLDSLKDIVSRYIEMGILTPLMRKILKTTTTDSNSPAYRTLITLDKTEPEIVINMPKSVEVGKRKKIQHFILPPSYKSAPISYTSLEHSILHIQNDYVEGVGIGESFIEAVSGQKFLGRFPVRVYKRNRATFIQFSNEEVSLDVGDKVKLYIESLPSNADNVSLVMTTASNNCIRILRDSENSITLEALDSGKSKVTAFLGDLNASCLVRVYQNLKSMIVSLELTEFKVDTVSHVEVHPIPSSAIFGTLSYSISPNHIAQFHSNIKALVGKVKGVGKLTVTDTRSNIKQDIEFRVV